MSDLQIALIILGAFIIAGVVLYNWLQERKLRNQVMEEFIVPQKDVLAEDFYIDTDAFVEKELAEVPYKFKHSIFEEPARESKVEQSAQFAEKPATGFNTAFNDATSIEQETQTSTYAEEVNPNLSTKFADEMVDAIQADSASGIINDNVINNSAVNQKSVQKPTAPDTRPPSAQSGFDNTFMQLPAAVHAQIDLTAMLYANKKINHQALCDMANSIDEIRLPMVIYGLDHAEKWHLVRSNQAALENASLSDMEYMQATCSLQLADRGGPVAKNLLNKFQFAVENMGLELNAHVEWQGSGDVLQRAIELDQFCIEVDQLINVHIAQGELPIHGTKFRGLAEASGGALNEDGKFYFYANNEVNYYAALQKLPLFSVIEFNNQPFSAESLRNSVLKAVTFQLEIPKVPSCEQAFNQMILIAQKLSSSLNANLVDDNQKPLGDLQIEKIRQQLKVIHATMVARGVMPGSAASMRLFN